MAVLLSNNIPILMYHEVSGVTERHKDVRYMTPLYDISETHFQGQMALLTEKKYRTIFPEHFHEVSDNTAACAILTFDDGLIGNHRFALPILTKYGHRAMFFVVTSMIGQDRYMNWNQLRELVDSGMSIQSHTVTHRPLQTLRPHEVYNELDRSRKILEDKLQKEVRSISMPHGSLNSKVIDAAERSGYRFIFTSAISIAKRRDFDSPCVVLGRIPITDKFSLRYFEKVIDGDPVTLAKIKSAKWLRNFVKNIIGIENYRRIYRYYFKIKT
jgi:peptidoglycan/xylan/chitin deacetylase (PgdA/CDA1 family)